MSKFKKGDQVKVVFSRDSQHFTAIGEITYVSVFGKACKIRLEKIFETNMRFFVGQEVGFHNDFISYYDDGYEDAEI